MTVFYVYELIDPRNNLPFYIGKGKNNRAYHHIIKIDKHNKLKQNKINKLKRLGYTIPINFIQTNMDESSAFLLETKLIKKYGRINNNTGILTNLTDGGEGSSGCNHTEKWKSYMRSVQPIKHSIYTINSQTYEIIKWESISKFRKTFKISQAQVYQSLKTKSCLCCGFWIRDITDENIKNNSIIDLNKFINESTRKYSNKQTIQKDLNNNPIKIWNSRTEIKTNLPNLNIDLSDLNKYIKKHKPYKGFIWENGCS